MKEREKETKSCGIGIIYTVNRAAVVDLVPDVNRLRNRNSKWVELGLVQHKQISCWIIVANV